MRTWRWRSKLLFALLVAALPLLPLASCGPEHGARLSSDDAGPSSLTDEDSDVDSADAEEAAEYLDDARSELERWHLRNAEDSASDAESALDDAEDDLSTEAEDWE